MNNLAADTSNENIPENYENFSRKTPPKFEKMRVTRSVTRILSQSQCSLVSPMVDNNKKKIAGSKRRK